MEATAPRAPVADAQTRELVAGNALLIALHVIHSLDHGLRQTASVGPEGLALGIAGMVVAVLALGLSIRGSRWAAHVTAAVGFATALGFVAVHVLPEWSVFSQPYADIDVDAISWVAMLVPAAGAALVGALGLRCARR